MNLKSKLQRSVKIHRTGAIIGTILSVISTWLAVTSSGGWQIVMAILAIWFALTIVRNIRTVRAARRVLSSPLFYLLAIEHDLNPKEKSS